MNVPEKADRFTTDDSSIICGKLLRNVPGTDTDDDLTNLLRVTVIEGTVKNVIKNEATGQVLGVQYVRKGEDDREYVLTPLEQAADFLGLRSSYFRCGWMFLKLQKGIHQETG